MEIWSKIAIFEYKLSKNLPGAPLGWKSFLYLPGYQNPMLGNRIFELSSIEKRVGETKPDTWAAILGFGE